jgi:uncharacterized NAD(P)/FAD-binding protein YdhS
MPGERRAARSVAIIGGGFSGAAVAIHLARWSDAPLSLSVVEPRAAVGAGLAHSTPEPEHRLNGPDAIHAPYPDAPSHFADWMRASGALAADPQAVAANGLVFPRRHDFGRYVAGEFERHARGNPSGSRIDHVRRLAQRISVDGDGVAVELDGGRPLRADVAVLALGWNAVGVPGPLAALDGHRGWLGDPWASDRLAALDPEAPVLLVGTGLTASDVFASLAARGHRAPVVALSRRGLRPASQNPHRSSRPMWERLLDADPEVLHRTGRPATVRAAVRALRREIAAVDAASSSWHVPFDALRDASWLFWPDWSDRDKRRWVRHVKGWYDAFRYRNPPQVERILDDALRERRLGIVAGRLHSARPAGGAIEVAYDARRDGARRRLRVAAVVNCTGPQPRPSGSGNPLWRALLADGLARDAASGLGVDVDATGRVLDAAGRAGGRLFAIGPPTIGRFGEAVAVPYVLRRIAPIAAAIGVVPPG